MRSRQKKPAREKRPAEPQPKSKSAALQPYGLSFHEGGFYILGAQDVLHVLALCETALPLRTK